MKKIILIASFVVIATITNAQHHFHMNPGVKAGLNLATLSGGGSQVDYSMRASLHAGVFLHMHFAKHWAIQPELMYSGQGTNYTILEENIHLNLSYLNFPVQLQYMFGNGLRVQSGPQAGLLLSAKAKSDGNSTDVKEGFNTLDFSWAFGASYVHRSGFGVDVRYNLGINNISDDDAESIRNSVVEAGLFYQFKGKKK